VLTVLEENTALAPEAFLERLGDMLHYPTLSMAALNQFVPAVDLLPFSDAVKRECVALRNAEGELLLGFADPFQSDIQAWAEARIQAPAAWHLVHPADGTPT
jgi:general secretion pathway protein E